MKLDIAKVKQRVIDIGLETGCGHIASALSCVEPLVNIYNLMYDPDFKNLTPDDIVILSKGHGALAQYVILNELGLLPDEVLATFHKDGGLSEHTTYAPEYGIHASTGSLGHGLGIGLGYAIANPDKMVFVILGDGELDEGSTYEAMKIMLDLNITNLRAVIDRNRFQGFKDASAFMLTFDNQIGVDIRRPYLIAESIKGHGFGKKIEDTLDSHYTRIDQKIYKNFKKFLKSYYGKTKSN